MAADLPFPKSLPEFQRIFPTDAACATYLEKLRWPEGFACECGEKGEPYRFDGRPGVLRCKACKRDVSLTAGTVMERTHTPLATWFWGAYLVTSLTPGMSAVQFQRQLGLGRYETAFQILHKLRAGMVRPERDKIGGTHTVEMDETWVGGKTRGEGRGSHNMTLVIAAVEVRRRAPAKPDVFGFVNNFAVPKRGGIYAGRLRMSVVRDRTAESLCGFARASIEPGSHVVTDDWTGYGKLSKFDLKHKPFAERGDPAVAEEHLPLVHLIFSNLKSWLLGVHHGVSPRHLQAYLNEFTFRFNRRFYPFNAFRSLLGIGAGAEAPTYDELYSGEWEHPNHAIGT